MKKLAIAIAALSLSAGAAFAENPYVGRDDVVQSGLHAGQPLVDRTATASIGERIAVPTERGFENPAANRFGDAAPRYQH